MEQHPLLDYAANNWGWHMRASEDQMMLLDVTVDFMQNERLFAAASQILLRRIARIHHWVGYSMWHATAYFDLHAVALHFLECGTLPDAEIILYAVQHQSDDVTKALIQHELDIDMKDVHRRTPLSYAVEGESVDIVKLLLAQQDIDINSKAKDGQTPFMYAVLRGSVEVVKLLLAREDVVVNLKDKNGQTPFMYAVLRGSVEVVKLLLAQQDIDVNSKDKGGQTPFICAIIGKSVEIVKLLLAQEDVDVNSKDKYWWTPLSHAVKRGVVEIHQQVLIFPIVSHSKHTELIVSHSKP
jgi:ankyrin repeat protein